MNIDRVLGVSTSVVSSTLRGWRGTNASRKVEQPAKLLELYDREGCAHCRFVREALTELNLDVKILPIPMGGKRFAEQLKEQSGSDQVPFLVDSNTGMKVGGSDAVVAYLFETYSGKPMPVSLKSTKKNVMFSRMATLVRGSSGLEMMESHKPLKTLTLYSFESSPYSRPVREKLCELELPYVLVNIGKQQRADMGPASFRLHLGEYKPLPNTKRSEFLAKYGDVQVPFLIDPNTGTEMFESADIVNYLLHTYKI